MDAFFEFLRILTAAFFGAGAAFLFQNRRDHAIERKMNLFAAQSAAYMLLRQFEFLVGFKKDVVRKIEATKADDLNIWTYKPQSDIPIVKIETLFFMLSEGGENELHAMDGFNERINSLVDSIEARNMEAENIKRKIEIGVLSSAQGKTTLDPLTNQVWGQVNSQVLTWHKKAEAEIEMLFPKVSRFFQKKFPKGKFVAPPDFQQPTKR